MKEWQELLSYIDYYVYVDAEEEIIIKHGPSANAALSAYEKGLGLLNARITNETAHRRLRLQPDGEKWEFDIALDCVRRMNDEDKEYVKKHMQTTEYHFGYAMGIRNKYIYPSKKHNHFDADGISSSVMRKVFSILSPVYDFRNGVISGFYDNFSMPHLMELYFDSFPQTFEDVVANLVKGGVYASANDAINDLKEKLRNCLGDEEFIRIFREAWKDYEENESKNDREDWYWETNFPACKAVLYNLQSKQMNALRRMRFFNQIERREIKSFDECRKYIDDNLGLREDYADYMARCAWEVCNPVFTGKWKTLSLFSLEIELSTKWKLEREGIKTLGDLCDCSFEQLSAMIPIGPDGAMKIKSEIESMGLSLAQGDE